MTIQSSLQPSQSVNRWGLEPTRLPDFQGGLRNMFTYKSFTLEIFFQYEYGRWATDGQVAFLSESLARINNLNAYYDARWTTPGQVTWAPRQNANGAESQGSDQSSGTRNWFKADYVRLKNVMMSYDFDNRFLTKMKLTNARFYVQATNLWTYSDWFSYDVEFVGTATGIVPQSKNFTAGLQFSF